MSNHLYDSLVAGHSGSPRPFLTRDGAPDLSFDDFVSMAARLAHTLAAHGLTPGDRVVVQAAKSCEMVALYIATIQAGGVFLPLNTAYTPGEVAYFVGDAKPRVIVCDQSFTDGLSPLAAQVDATLLVLNADGSGSLTDGWPTAPPPSTRCRVAPGTWRRCCTPRARRAARKVPC